MWRIAEQIEILRQDIYILIIFTENFLLGIWHFFFYKIINNIKTMRNKKNK